MSAPFLFLVPLVGLLGASMPAPSAAAEVVAYRAARLWTGEGPPVADAVLVVVDGRIVGAGPKEVVEVPEAARVVELGPSSVIIPGLVAADSGLGAVSSDDERALTPGVRAIDGFDPFAEYDGPLSGGVTTAHLSPGRNRLIPGRGAVVKLAGPNPVDRTLISDGDVRIVLSGEALNPPRIYEPPPRLASRDRPVDPTQPQLASSLAGAVSGLRSVIEAARSDRGDDTDLLLDPLADALDATGRLRITAPGAAEIRAALTLARTFDLRLILAGPTELSPWVGRLDSWADAVDGVILDLRVRPGQIADLPIPDPDSPEPREPWQDAAALIEAGLPVAVVPSTDADLNELLFLASQFTAGGLSDEEVLRMITATPAELLGVDDRVGTLAEGKDADFVVLSGDPFDLHSTVRQVFVSGRQSWSSDAKPKAVVIRAGSVLIGDGSELDGASIVVEGRTIRGVGPDVSALVDADILVFDGAVVTPGLLDLATDLGLGGPLSAAPSSGGPDTSSRSFPRGIIPDDDEEENDGGPSRTSLSLETKLGERLVSRDPASAVARRGGITTVLTGPRDISPAPVVAFKLGDEPTVLADPVALRFRFSGNATSAASGLRSNLGRAKAYADSWDKYAVDLAEYEEKKKEYEEAKARLEARKRAEEVRARAEAARRKAEEARKEAEDESKDSEEKTETPDDESKGGSTDEPESADESKDEPEKTDEAGDSDKDPEEADSLPPEPEAPKKPNTVATLEPYRPLFAGEIPALVEVDRLDGIRSAIEIFRDEFSLDTILLGAADAFRELDLLAEKEVAAVVGPSLIQQVDRQSVNLAQLFATRAVPFGFQSQAGTGSASLPRAIRYAVRLGLGTGDALAGLTSAPATFLGLDDRIGTIAPGRDADLVVWSGPPFSPSSRVLAVMIDGHWVYQEAREDERR